MATFYVGQRVRLIHAFYPENIGATGRITELFDERPCTNDGSPINCAVARDKLGRGKYSHTSKLEPILPDGHRACDDDFKRDLDRLLERQGVMA